MGLKAFTDGVADLLVNDSTFAAALAALIGAPVTRVLRANTPWQQIGNDLLPCFVLEQGDGSDASASNEGDSGQVIGHGEQQFASELDIALLWHAQDREVAGDQRAQLPGLFAQLFLRHPQPGGIDGAWLQGWSPDQGVRHPLQTFVAMVHGEYTVEAMS